VPRICEFYPGICLTTEEKARKKPQSTPEDKLRKWEVDKRGSGSCAKPGFRISGTQISNSTITILDKIFQKLPALYNLYKLPNSFISSSL